MMSKLIWAEMKRYLISPNFIACIFILIVLNSMHSTGWIPILSNLFYWGDQFMYNNSILAVLLSIIIASYIYKDFFTKTIYSRLILGYSKSQIFIAETLSCGLGSGILVAIGSAIYVLKRRICNEEYALSIDSIIIDTIIFMSSITCIAIIISSFCLLLKKSLITPIFLMCITVLLLQHGTEDISLLTFSESTLAVQNENETDEGKDLIETNLRVSDKVRNRLNAHVMLSPFAQCNYSAYLYIERPEDKPKLSFLFKDNPYHFDFLLSNIVLSSLVILIGANIYKRQNI